MKRIIFFCIFITGAICYSHAQYSEYSESRHRMGFRVGIGLSSISGLHNVESKGLPNVNYEINNFKASPKFSWDIGYSYQYEKDEKFYFQSDILFANATGTSVKGVTRKYENDISSINITGLYLETFMGRKIMLNNGNMFAIGAGPYLEFQYSTGYGGSGDLVYHEVCDEDGYCWEESSVVGGEGPKKQTFGMGLTLMIGFEFGNNQIALIGTQGLTNVFKNSDYNSKMRTFKVAYSLFFISL